MKNKIKLIDRLKSWLVTFGIASVFGLAALGVNAAKSYDKASAYEYDNNGQLSFSTVSSFDYNILSTYISNHYYEYDTTSLIYSSNLSILFNLVDNDNVVHSVVTSTAHYDVDNYTLFFGDANGEPDGVITIVYDDTHEFVDNYFDDFTFSANFIQNDTFYSLSSYEGYQSLRNYVLSYNAPQQSGNFVTALTSFMSLIGGGIVDLAQTIGAGVVSFASGLFLDSGHLSILGGIIGIFAGIALAVGITSKVYTWVSTLGN